MIYSSEPVLKNPRENGDKQMADFEDSCESRVSFVVGFRRRVKQLNTAAGNSLPDALILHYVCRRRSCVYSLLPLLAKQSAVSVFYQPHIVDKHPLNVWGTGVWPSEFFGIFKPIWRSILEFPNTPFPLYPWWFWRTFTYLHCRSVLETALNDCLWKQCLKRDRW